MGGVSTLLRLGLFLGLVVHKLVWEVLKRRAPARAHRVESPAPPVRWMVKAVKVGVLSFLAVQTLFLDILPITSEPSSLRIIGVTGVTLYVLGLLTAVMGRLHLGDNWVDLEDYQVLQRQALVTRGIYRYIRHPIYAGDILLLVGLELALNSWLVLAVVIPLAVVVRQARAEEALLAQAFADYRPYQARTKRFIPFVT